MMSTISNLIIPLFVRAVDAVYALRWHDLIALYPMAGQALACLRDYESKKQ